MSEWRPIETAPKDGTFIFVFECHPFDMDSPEFNYDICAWESEMFTALGGKGCWNSANSDYHIEPTHWMPLPEPPKCKD